MDRRWSQRAGTLCTRAGAVLLPAVALGAAPWVVRNSQAAEMPPHSGVSHAAPAVVLSGHVFAHGCTPISAKLDGQPIRVDTQGNFAVAVRAPKHRLTATFEFSAPGCTTRSRQMVLQPGVLRYGLSASVFPHFAAREARQPFASRQLHKQVTLADSTHKRLPRQMRDVAALVERYATEAGLNPALVLAVVHTESNFDVHAHSHANAVGLMQLVPHLGASEAARYLVKTSGNKARHIKVNKVTLRDPDTNLRLGTAYLKMLMQRYYGDVSNKNTRRTLALAAYNWGPGNMSSAIAKSGQMPATPAEVNDLLQRYAPRETQRYVHKVMRRMAVYEKAI